MKGSFASAIVISAVLVSAAANAQTPPPAATTGGSYFGTSITDTSAHSRPGELSVMAFVPWYYGFGIGATVRYAIPIVPDGFIPQVNDSFSIEPGLSIAFGDYGGFGGWTILTPQVFGIWRFYFSESFAAYAGLGLGYSIALAYAAGYSPAAPFIDGVVGLNWKFSPSVSLRAEVGNEATQVGVTFAF